MALRHLERLPPSDGREQLCVLAQECMQETEMWSVSSPTMRELDVPMKHVLALHTEVTKLQRHTLVPEGDAPTPWNGSAA